ncbi:MAG: VOC family protein [Meiothermus sp.]|nr:VOC family protein [Meiothermus sp.]
MFPESVPDKTFFQLCVIVDDLERYAENYRQILGFEVPTEVQTTHDYRHTQALYHGRPMDARARIVSWMLGGVAFELLQPLDEGSIWMDFLKSHGPGIHHAALHVPRTSPAAAFFADQGYRVTQQGLFTGRTGMYAYLDTDQDLGLTWELLEHYGGGAHPAPRPFPADRGLGTDRVIQLGLVVKDIEAIARRYREVFGLPEPATQETPGHNITEATFHGQPSETTAKLAFFGFGQAQLELIQPDPTPSVWRDYLDAKGDSAHHIAFGVADTGKAVAHFARFGIGVAQQGLYGDRSGMYTYMDSEPQLGIIIELLENFAQPR